MPDFEISDPQGKKFIVTVPAGKGQQDAINFFMSQKGAPTAPKEPAATFSERFQPAEQAPLRDASWKGTAQSALQNVIPSAKNFGSSMVQPILHPQETASAIKNLGLGILEKAGIKGGTEHEKYADAVGKFFVDRYGSIEKAKQTIATDPVGFASDLSTILSGGGMLGARLPGVAGTVAKAAATAGKVIDPLSAAGKVTAKVAGPAVAHAVGALGTHTGGEPIIEAARAGLAGGEKGEAFTSHLRGQALMEDVVAEARQGVAHMRQVRGADYRAGMSAVGKDKTILSFNDIDRSLAEMEKVKTFKGISLSPTTEAIRSQMTGVINQWKNLKASEYWTPEGFDAMKQKLGDIRDATQYGTPERVVADQIYQAVRNTIIKQDKNYAKVMKGYETATNQIKEIERTLSLNPNARIDTALRKLQSVLRNNVNTNYGYRTKLAQFLVNAGAPHLMEKLAGQALSSWAPRGLGKLAAAVTAGGALEHAASGGGPGGIAALAAILPGTSPRMVGEAAYHAGAAARKLPVRGAARAAYQSGRGGVYEQ